MTGTKTMDKFYITKQKHLELDKENAGYGTCEARIPLMTIIEEIKRNNSD